MEEERTDVEGSVPSTEEVSQEGVNQADNTSQPTTDAEPKISTAPPGAQDVEAVDEMGVPWKNRAMENQRKLEKTLKQQEEILEKVSSLSQAQQQKPQYTVEELEAFAIHPDTSEAHRLWALREIKTREEQRMSEVVRSEFEKREQLTKTEQAKKDALNQVMSRHPDAFVKNQAGQIVAWNPNSPLTQRIGQYMNDPEIANNPRGLLVASALAYQDISTQTQVQTQKKMQTLKNEAGSLKKKTLLEAGGAADIPPPSPRQRALEKSKSGRTKDAVEIMKELWKATGRLEE